MMAARTSLEVIAPSVDEAIAQGLADLGLARDQVEVEILDAGARGLFGLGNRQARVRLTLRSAAEQASSAPDLPAPQPESSTAPAMPSEDEDEQPIASASAPVAVAKAVPDEIMMHVARETVIELLEKMHVTADVTAEFKEPDDEHSKPTLWVDVRGDDLSFLIGPRAETLSALQYIASLIVSKEIGHSMQLVVDVEGYRIRKVQQLRQLARRMADQAINTGHRQVLEPMPASDRRIIHIEVRAIPQVTSESTGEEPYRKVTIAPIQEA